MVSFPPVQTSSFDIFAEMRSFTEHVSKALNEATVSISDSWITRVRTWMPEKHCNLKRCQQIGKTFSQMATASLSESVTSTSIKRRVVTLIGIGKNWLDVHSSSSIPSLSSSSTASFSSSSASIRSPFLGESVVKEKSMSTEAVVVSGEHAIFSERITHEHDRVRKLILNAEQSTERALQEMISFNRSDFISMDTEELPQITVTEQTEQYTVINSRGKRIGEFLFWLKTEIGQEGRVGLSVCAGEWVPPGARVLPHPASIVSGVSEYSPRITDALIGLGAADIHPAARENPLLPNPAEMSVHPYVAKQKFPITVDYQLFAQQLGTPHAVCKSPVFRTEFGRHRAWGMSKFTTLEKLEKEGAYIKFQEKLEEKEAAVKENTAKQKKDRLILGCTVYRIKGFGLASLTTRL